VHALNDHEKDLDLCNWHDPHSLPVDSIGWVTRSRKTVQLLSTVGTTRV